MKAAQYLREGDVLRARSAAARKRDPEKVRKYLAAYAQANRDALREYQRRYYAEHSDKLREKSRNWARSNVDRRRAHHAARKARIRRATVIPTPVALVQAKMQYWGNVCWMCGGPGGQIDHVKPIAKGGPHMLANLRPACGPCNLRKSDRWGGVELLSEFMTAN